MPSCLSFGKKEIPKEERRQIKVNDLVYNQQFQYANNYIKTSKYNLFTFVPKNLFEQFQRLANFYFLILMILQLIPTISSLTPLTTILPLCFVLLITAMKDFIDDLLIPQVSSLSYWTTVLPLLFVLSVSGIKDLHDDVQRHRNDRQVNNRKSYVIRNGRLAEEIWQNVIVGDIIRMEEGHFVAADLLLLSTSEPNGLCFIETAELDGETNLKAKQALPDTADLMEDNKKMSEFNGEITCEPPNNNLSKFEGKLSWSGSSYSLDNEKILLRGCILRNTKWCYGIVIFAGKDTKLMMNCGKTKFKRTSLDRFLNILILGIVIFLGSMCLICTILCGVWEKEFGHGFKEVLPRDSAVKGSEGDGRIAFIAFLSFFSYAILLNTVVPISLYVSVEIIRFAHSWWINWDREMYHEETMTAAKSRTTTLNEELGQIQYIFSDKTGTLTQNKMTFNKCSINGVIYGDVLDESGTPINGTPDKQVDLKKGNPFAQDTSKFVWYDETLLQDTKDAVPDVALFWRLLALCHTVMPEEKEGILLYQAQSPDESALVNAARNFGYVFKSRTPQSVTIEVEGKEETWDLLCILDFNNVRKRMSVIVRSQQGDKKLMLLCKGADTLVVQLLRNDTETNKLKQMTNGHLDKFASDGLRTLLCAYKEIDEGYFAQWQERQKEASESLDNRQEKLDEVYEEIEQGMQLIGATAIEDELQDGVPETIANLAEANIKIWVLTGDKQETAINIGYSCRLLTEQMHDPFIVDATEKEDVKKQLTEAKHAIFGQFADNNTNYTNGGLSPTQTNGTFKNSTSTSSIMFSSNQHAGSTGNVDEGEGLGLEGYALVINGHSLTHALGPDMEMLLLDVGCACKAVICCRVTPLQKANVVDLVKRNKKAVTLSVGDGANDVSMIKTAHIGVGISGQEGLQAVLASDFSIAQFRFLERLLLVHGRWSYFRMSKFLKYFFYKNFAFTLGHFWFAFFCGYSARTIYDPTFIACYNLFFTSMPVLALGIFDQDVNDQYSIKYPKLYIPGQYNLYFNMRIFVYSVLHGIVSSLIIFFVPYGALYEATSDQGNDLGALALYGFTMFTSLVITVTAQIALDTSYWTMLNHVVIWVSIIFYFFVAIVAYQGISIYPDLFRGVAFQAMASPQFWFIIFLTVVLLMVPVALMRFFWFDTHPTLSDRIRVKQRKREKMQTGVSEFNMKARATSSSRRSAARRSFRSAYAFSHERGYGDLITRGLMRMKMSHSKNHLGTGLAQASISSAGVPLTINRTTPIEVASTKSTVPVSPARSSPIVDLPSASNEHNVPPPVPR